MGIEAFAISVFPRRPWFDIGGIRTDSLDPVLHGLSNKLRAVVKPNERWEAAQDEQVTQMKNRISAKCGRCRLELYCSVSIPIKPRRVTDRIAVGCVFTQRSKYAKHRMPRQLSFRLRPFAFHSGCFSLSLTSIEREKRYGLAQIKRKTL